MRRAPIFALELLFGIALVGIVLFDVFETIVVPRRTESVLRLAPHVIILLWPIWRHIGVRLTPGWRREDFLGTFAPFVLVLVMISWVLALILGFGLILHALPDQIQPPLEDFETALYLAGTSLLTVGFGDFVPVALGARVAVLVAAASGLAVLALVIALTFNLYGSFARREMMVLMLEGRAGAPSSGVMLLETFGRYKIVDELSDTFKHFELWTAEMLDSHLAYPILSFFRSSHDNLSWVSALGAVLDAATLLITAVEDDPHKLSDGLIRSRASARMVYTIGCHALVDLTQLRFARRHLNTNNKHPGIERGEFEAACRQLREAGYPTSCSEESWQAFVQHRSVYAVHLNTLARYFASPPTPWIGDRTVLTRLRPAHLGP